MTDPMPRWMHRTATAAVALVALVAAVVSYAHLHTLADRAGESWRAWLLPLSVDGLLVAASLALVARRRSGQPSGWLPWCGLLLGLAVSLAANMAAAQPTLIGRLVASWPPVALGIAFELLLGLGRPQAATPTNEQPTPQPRPEAPDDQLMIEVRAFATRLGRRPSRNAVMAELNVGADRATRLLDHLDQQQPDWCSPVQLPDHRTDEQLLTRLRALADQTGARPSRNAVMTELRVGSARATRLLNRLDQPDEPAPERLHSISAR